MLKKLLTVVLALVFLSACGEKKEDDGTIKIGMSMDYPPFDFRDSANNPSGFDVDLLAELAKRVDNFKYELINISFDGLIPALKAGKIDAIVSMMSATDDRRASVDFTDPYYFGETIYIAKKTAAHDRFKLEGLKIGYQIGTVQEKAAKELKGVEIVPFDAPVTAIQSLKVGKIDVVMTDAPVGINFMKENDDISSFYIEPDGSEGISMAFNKDKYIALIVKINKALADMKKDGTLDQIAKKYELKQ
ncbi:MAG: transporter substrate-binding domain-containing protein [Campylobacter sp.]|nr:transporter substrate-binding domain-containing protein [Campylobacter sp.]